MLYFINFAGLLANITKILKNSKRKEKKNTTSHHYTKGRTGKNISLDLHMEHLNKILKELLNNLRNNLDEANADRIAKATNDIKRLIEKT